VEKRLWRELRSGRLEGIKFRRQHPIGRYVADFCAPSLRLVIELDGGQHAEPQQGDALRTLHLESQGYRVLRFWNSEVNEALEAVLERIRAVIQSSASKRRDASPSPGLRPAPPQRGEARDRD